jgi:dihydroorotase
LTIFDPEADRLVTDHFASKAANSPFVGEKLKGQVKFTICDGEVVFEG